MDHLGDGLVSHTDWEGMELPGGYRLERDRDFGYLKVAPRPFYDELAEYYGNHYRPPVRPHDPEGRVELVCSLHPQQGRVLDIGCGGGSCSKYSCITVGT